jgi:hypothetical protein
VTMKSISLLLVYPLTVLGAALQQTKRPEPFTEYLPVTLTFTGGPNSYTVDIRADGQTYNTSSSFSPSPHRFSPLIPSELTLPFSQTTPSPSPKSLPPHSTPTHTATFTPQTTSLSLARLSVIVSRSVPHNLLLRSRVDLRRRRRGLVCLFMVSCDLGC